MMTKRKASTALETGTESDHSNSTQDNNSNSNSATNNTTGNTTNNQPNHNGLTGNPSNNDNGPHQVGDGNLSHAGQQKNKKERADNWSSAEIQVLHRGIENRRDIFCGPPNQATKRNRELAWDAITKEVNSVSTTPRSLSQVMKKFKNEKCRAKRKFMDAEKDGHNNLNNTGAISVNSNCNSSSANTNNGNATLGAQHHASNSAANQPQQGPQSLQQPPHHMTTSETISTQTSSAINVVKLAPHMNVAKTMIDLPGHVQQIQMPSDDMVLIVQQEDALISGMNIVSDGNGHHHFQKCTTNGNIGLNNQQHNQHGHPALQPIGSSQGLVNGTMGNGMIARTIPGSMCSLVYSTGSEVCGNDPHLTGANQMQTNHLGVNTQTLMHHRGPLDQGQGQQQQQPTQQQQQQQHPHHHQMHQHQHPQQPPPQQQQPPQSHHQLQQSSQHQHQPPSHHQQPLHQSQIANTGANSNSGGAAVDSQLKNLLFNLLLKDGQTATQLVNSGQDVSKQRNEILGVIANTLGKIESHLSKISKVANSMLAHSINTSSGDNNTGMAINNQTGGMSIPVNDDNNNSVSISGPTNTNVIGSNQAVPET